MVQPRVDMRWHTVVAGAKIGRSSGHNGQDEPVTSQAVALLPWSASNTEAFHKGSYFCHVLVECTEIYSSDYRVRMGEWQLRHALKIRLNSI